MVFKLLGAVTVFACGTLYALNSERTVEAELAEAEYLLSVFGYVKDETEEFDTPLFEILRARGFDGVETLISNVKSEGLCAIVSEARSLGRGYKKEELRVCNHILCNLESAKKSLEAKARETKAISRVKGLGLAAAAGILLV